MHISEIEKARMEKEHQMRHGYQIHDNKQYPHIDDDAVKQHLYHDVHDNKHAAEMSPGINNFTIEG